MLKRERQLNTILWMLYGKLNVTYTELRDGLIPYYFDTQHDLISALDEIKTDGHLTLHFHLTTAERLYSITDKGKTFKRNGGYVWDKLADLGKKWSWVIVPLLGAVGVVLTYLFLK